MEVSPRDNSVVQLVARFKHLRTDQIRDLAFRSNASRTPCDDALRRLVRESILAKIECRTVGGSRGGSGQHVYALGRRGWYTYYSGRLPVYRAVDYHALAIADTYMAFRSDADDGAFEIVSYHVEADAWVNIAGFDIRPDLEIVLRTDRRQIRIWAEIDMATEGQKQIRGKLMTYWQAYQSADPAELPEFPSVLWVAKDAERAKELAWIISTLPTAAQELFTVTTLDKVRGLIRS